MVFENIFSSVCWIVFFLIIWFQTDWIYHYCKLFKIFKNFQNSFAEFISNDPDSYFPDYLSQRLTKADNLVLDFISNLITCPFCVTFWLCLASFYPFCLNLVSFAPVYVLSLITFLGIKKLS